MRILITGANGQLGSELKELLSPHHKVHAYDLDLDVTDHERVISEVQKIKPEAVIHCAAYTDVDGCEQNPTMAAAVNDEGTGYLVLACQQVNAIMVYVSTDFVFDGKSRWPYKETDLTHPINVYGKTKRAGELRVQENLKRFLIIRTSWLFGGDGDNFVKKIVGKALAGENLRIVDDQIGRPTYARDLAGAIVKLLDSARYGTYHISNTGFCSWFDFARKIIREANLKSIKITPIQSAELDLPAKRPAYSVLSLKKLSGDGIIMRHYSDAVRDYISAKGPQWGV